MKLFLLQDDTSSGCLEAVKALRSAAHADHLEALQVIIENVSRFSNLGNWPLDVILAAANSGQAQIIDFALSGLGADINGSIRLQQFWISLLFTRPRLVAT